MTGWILKLILLILVLRAVVRLVRGIIEGVAGAARIPQAVALVRDPICGTFVVPSEALSAGKGNRVHYFCSKRCLSEFQKR